MRIERCGCFENIISGGIPAGLERGGRCSACDRTYERVNGRLELADRENFEEIYSSGIFRKKQRTIGR